MFQLRTFFILFTFATVSACARQDTDAPVLELNTDNSIHYRGTTYNDPGFSVADNHDCNVQNNVEVLNTVDENRYGSYTVTYTVADNAGNQTEEIRAVDIVLPLTDYYSQTWKAYDTCTSGNYDYYGLIQDCDCYGDNVTVGNISNFGLSAAFTLPVSGQFSQFLTLDTTKAAVNFFGTATMNPTADSLKWSYLISDSISTDVCTSVWIKM